MADAAKEAVFDFTNVKDGGGSFNKKRQPEGDYRAKVMKVADAPSKKDGVAQWLFTIQVGSGTYPFYCKHDPDQYWKLRNLLIAAGLNVPKKKMKVDPNKLVGKEIAVTLEDDEYDGKLQSNIAATFPLSELTDDDTPDEPDDADDGEDEEDEPKPKGKSKPKVADDDEDDEEEDDEEISKLASLDRTELKQLIAKEKLDVTVRKSMSDDDIRSAIQAAQTTKSDDDDDDLEEIDIDDS